MSSASDTRIVRLMIPPFCVAWGRVCAGRQLRVKRVFSGRINVVPDLSPSRPSHCRKFALHEPLAHPPLVLAEKDAAQLAEPVRGIVERAEDALAVLDRQRQDNNLGLDGAIEKSRGRLIDEGRGPASDRRERGYRRASSADHMFVPIGRGARVSGEVALRPSRSVASLFPSPYRGRDWVAGSAAESGWTSTALRHKMRSCVLGTHSCRVGCEDAHGLRAGALITVPGGRCAEGSSDG